MVTIVIATAAFVALGVLVPAVRRARIAGDLDSSTALTFGIGWLISLPVALVAISGGLTRQQDAFRQLVTILPSWYPSALEAATGLAGVLAAFLIVRRLTSHDVTIHVAGLLAIVLWSIAQFASGLQGGPVLSTRAAVLLLCLIAATLLPRGRGAAVGAGIFGVTIAIASGLLALFRYDVAFVVPCGNQCGVLGLALTGILANEDLLGIALAAAIPFAFLGFRGRARYALTLYLAGMAIATGSRTAGIAAVISVFGLFILRPRLDADRTTFIPAAIAGLLLAGALFGSIFVTQYHGEAGSLSNRQPLWRVASEYIHRSPWLGNGPEKWSALNDSSEIPLAARRSAHNQWMDVLFVAGWVGAALFVGAIAAAILSSGSARVGVMIAVATILMIGTAEGTWSIGAVDFMSFSLVALILTGATKRGLAVGSTFGRTDFVAQRTRAEVPI